MLFLIALAIAMLVAVSLFAGLWLSQQRMTFPGGRDVWCTPADRGWVYEDVTLRPGNETTCAWFIPCPNSRGTALFSHGNAGTIADRMDSVAIFRDLGFDVFLYDYGGYGHSSGRPSEKRCYEDIRAAWRYLTEDRHIPPLRILLFGRSLGGAVTADLACEVTAGAVILESTFLSTRAFAQDLVRHAPPRFLLRYEFDTASKIKQIHSPILIVHSPEDNLIPYRHGKELFALANDPKEFLEIRGSHGEGFFLSGAVYTGGLRRFLDRYFPK